MNASGDGGHMREHTATGRDVRAAAANVTTTAHRAHARQRRDGITVAMARREGGRSDRDDGRGSVTHAAAPKNGSAPHHTRIERFAALCR
jgi:hypothetical protein